MEQIMQYGYRFGKTLKMKQIIEDFLLIRRITKVVRLADKRFKTTGGSSRHWVIECFLPLLEQEGLKIIEDK